MGKSRVKNKSNEQEREDLRTEYSAISQYHNSLVTFRLTLLGLYLAALAFLVGNDWPINIHICILGLLLTFCMYIFELRTRVLFEAIAKRAIAIEKENWGAAIDKKDRFYILQYPVPKKINYDVKIRIFSKELPDHIQKTEIISHSVALDFLYVGLFIFFSIALIISVFSTPNLKPLLLQFFELFMKPYNVPR